MISIPITVYNKEQPNLFVSYQRTIDDLIRRPYNQKMHTKMLEEFRRIYANDDSILVEIELFEENYHMNNAIHWYTRNSFLWRTISQALRSNDIVMMYIFRPFLVDLYIQLDIIYQETYYFPRFSREDKFYRGQILSRTCFHSFQQSIGHIISINTFFSTTTSCQIALAYVDSFPSNDECLPVIFSIENNGFLPNQRPYADIFQFSNYPDEEEVLFAMGSIFRLQSIQDLDATKSIPVIYLQMIDPSRIN